MHARQGSDIFPDFLYAARKRQLAEIVIYERPSETHFVLLLCIAGRMKRQYEMSENAINVSAITDVPLH